MTDSAGQVLGRLLASDATGVRVLTSTGHQVSLQWDGTVAPAQLWFSNGGCEGTAYLNSGGSTPVALWGMTVVRSARADALFVPKTVDTSGQSVSLPSVATASLENGGTCVETTGGNGWELRPVTREEVGLPATLTPPLKMP